MPTVTQLDERVKQALGAHNFNLNVDCEDGVYSLIDFMYTKEEINLNHWVQQMNCSALNLL